MASLYRKTQTHWELNGKRCKPGTPGAVKVQGKSKNWYGKYKENGTWKEVPLSANRKASLQLLSKYQTDADMRKAGLPSEIGLEIDELLSRYHAYLSSKQSTRKHVGQTIQRIRSLVDGLSNPQQITDTYVSVELSKLRQEKPTIEFEGDSLRLKEVCKLLNLSPNILWRIVSRYELEAHGLGRARRYPRATVEALIDKLHRGLSPQTSNHYLRCIKGFTRWLYHENYLPKDPLLSLKPVNTEVDTRVVRRSLSQEELALLIEETKKQKNRRGLSGEDRSLLYLTAARSGLRSDELASLTLESVRDDCLLIHARDSKHRRHDVQPIPAKLACLLRDHFEGKQGKLWPGTWHDRAADMLYCDLRAAGIPIHTVDGSVDFHALRSTYITHLMWSGADPKTVQILARHSTITLTLDKYAKSSQETLKKFANSLDI